MTNINNQHEAGYIFLIVLIFLQIFSMLSLASFLSIKSVLKQNTEQCINENNLFLGLTVLNRVEHHLPSNCFVSLKNGEDLSMLPMNWWYLNACKAQFYHLIYYYIIEFLGTDPCSLIEIKNNNHLVTADFYKVTLIVDLKYKKLFLQSTIAKANDGLLSCQNKLHKIKMGRQMWRELRMTYGQ